MKNCVDKTTRKEILKKHLGHHHWWELSMVFYEYNFIHQNWTIKPLGKPQAIFVIFILFQGTSKGSIWTENPPYYLAKPSNIYTNLLTYLSSTIILDSICIHYEVVTRSIQYLARYRRHWTVCTWPAVGLIVIFDSHQYKQQISWLDLPPARNNRNNRR